MRKYRGSHCQIRFIQSSCNPGLHFTNNMKGGYRGPDTPRSYGGILHISCSGNGHCVPVSERKKFETRLSPYIRTIYLVY